MTGIKVAGLTLAYWSMIGAALLPLVCAVIAKWGKLRVSVRQGGYDNHLPRAWLARQVDWRARANAAQANSFEALPLFMAAVIVAHQAGAPQLRLDLLAFLFLVLRMIYIMMYVADLATARSIVWTLALLVNLAIFFT
jgi:uncharacterized MAPEG superfamily protein